MREAAEFFERFRAGLVGGLNTCMLAEIVAFDAAAMKADVELLPDRDLVKAVPVAAQKAGGFVIRVPYKEGDTVVVVFAQRDIDAIMHGEEGATDRVLDLNDAIIVGGMTLFADPLPDANAEDMIIARSDMTTKIVIDPDGKVTIEAAGGLYLGGGSTEGVPLGAQLKQWLDNHTHDYTDDGVTRTTAPPSNPSPEPSTGVFVK